MAHGKETPRQKMIGMMYLVLMAMLALNVSKEVLNAFVLVDEGLVKTTKNFAQKNDIYYQAFDKAAAENPVKAGPWQASALEVKRRSDELVNYIQELKLELVRKADGDDATAIHGEEVHAGDIKQQSELNIPAEQMIGSEGGRKGNELKAAIEGLREYFLSLIAEENESIRESIESSLDTHGHTDKKGETHSWQETHFSHNPLVGVVALMSKMQSDVRNAESEALNYLYGQIDAGSFKFNLIEPVVIPRSTNVIRGNDYQSDIFMAAFDTTQEPTVYIGRYDSTVNDDGTVEYHMVGELGTDYDTIPVTGGKGVYVAPGRSLGQQSYQGIISLKRMDGTRTNKPFHASYNVDEPALVVSPTQMNVFYNAIDNPVAISVPGYPANSIRATFSHGRIVGSGTQYTVTPNREANEDIGLARVSVSVVVDGQTRSMGSKPFRVDPLPPPRAMLAGRPGGAFRKSQILGEMGLKAEMPESFKFGGVNYTVTSYIFEYVAGGVTYPIPVQGGNFSTEVRSAINNSRPNSSIYFTDIKVIGPDGVVQDLGTIRAKLQ